MKYMYHQHIKVQIWQDQKFTIGASSKEEADAIAKQFANIDVSNSDAELVSSEFLYDTQEFVKPDGDFPTIEIYADGNLIADNREK